jgi:hypothetical protein
MTREQIAQELMRDCPTEAMADHNALARAIREGIDKGSILSMLECDRWPETHVWLKTELNNHQGKGEVVFTCRECGEEYDPANPEIDHLDGFCSDECQAEYHGTQLVD